MKSCIFFREFGWSLGIAQWESHGNGNWLQNWEWEWEGMGIDWMGMGGNGNIKSHSRSSLVALLFNIRVPTIRTSVLTWCLQTTYLFTLDCGVTFREVPVGSNATQLKCLAVQHFAYRNKRFADFSCVIIYKHKTQSVCKTVSKMFFVFFFVCV